MKQSWRRAVGSAGLIAYAVVAGTAGALGHPVVMLGMVLIPLLVFVCYLAGWGEGGC